MRQRVVCILDVAREKDITVDIYVTPYLFLLELGLFCLKTLKLIKDLRLLPLLYFRLLYVSELDPLTIAIQEELDLNNGFNKDHIFYKLIMAGFDCAHRTPGSFSWPKCIVDFANTIESVGGESTCNMLRGPGNLNSENEDYWSQINIPFPAKNTRQRSKPPFIVENGVLTHSLKSFTTLASTTTPLISNDSLAIFPVCLSRDAMAIKPSGDLNLATQKIVGLKTPIDLEYVKANPLPDPLALKDNMYTEAGAIITTTLDGKCSLLVANDFLTKKTTGDEVFSTLSSTIQITQTCVNCLNQIKAPTVTKGDVLCDSICKDCIEQKTLCDLCSATNNSIYPQLRACKCCIRSGLKCTRTAVIAVSMDCESNNAKAMDKLGKDRSELPPHLLLTYAVPDAVHAGKKVFRASANWWLWLNGNRINNLMIRSLRQFDESLSPKLKPILSDAMLRNRDRMDYGTILKCVDTKVHTVIKDQCMVSSSLMTTTLHPNPFWKLQKSQELIKSVADMCAGM